MFFVFFFFNDTATTEIYTLSLHDALPIFTALVVEKGTPGFKAGKEEKKLGISATACRSEEHTSELQSLTNLVCRLLLEKKKKTYRHNQAGTGKHASQCSHENLRHQRIRAE